MHRTILTVLFFLPAYLLLSAFPSQPAIASPPKVLVVMSYNENQPWENEIRKGIESVLAGKARTHYVYLNTKYNLSQGSENARKAFAFFQEFQPDGVIAADDDAQALFVVPHLKDKVRTPVMFCGVNNEAGRYGYPATNVSGILERAHISESIAFLQQLVPSVRKIAYIAPNDIMGKTYKRQIDEEARSYSAKSLPVKLVHTLEEAINAAKEAKKRSDALVLLSMASLKDSSNNRPTDTSIFRALSQHFGKPIISINDFEIRHGLLGAVVKSGREQGATASKMLLKAMNGTPVSRIPITKNLEGKRMVNVTVMKSLGIKPRPIVLRGAELVHTEE